MATHLKGLARKVKINEGHAKAARAYKARVASLTSKRAELQGQVQHMAEEAVKLESDLKHTTSARALAEGREDEARNILRAAEAGQHVLLFNSRLKQDKAGCLQRGAPAERPAPRRRAPRLVTSTPPCGKTLVTVKGPDHLDFNFPGKKF